MSESKENYILVAETDEGVIGDQLMSDQTEIQFYFYVPVGYEGDDSPSFNRIESLEITVSNAELFKHNRYWQNDSPPATPNPSMLEIAEQVVLKGGLKVHESDKERVIGILKSELKEFQERVQRVIDAVKKD